MNNKKSIEYQLVRDGNDIVFPDNGLLAELCGQFDGNLAYIENSIEAELTHRGNVITVIGDEKELGLKILDVLYHRLLNGKSVSETEIDATLRQIDNLGNSNKNLQKNTPSYEIKTRKKIVEARTEAQKKYIKSFINNEMVFGIGPAGTGKTYIAVAIAASRFIGGHVDKIILSRPAVEAGERLGFLPGDMKDKVDPYMQPLYDALNDFFPIKQLTRLLEDKQIEIAPLAFMRGRTLSNSFVVLDEAQNATAMQMKMFLTRLGEGSQMAITGDITQIDLQRGVLSGLKNAEALLKDVEGISFNYFTSKDVIRHKLVAKIINAYALEEKS
ncbi:PhoH family protein [Paracoccaceae bacterium]|nr:PhoH family protein [Paracoccaceae bacterium]MDA9123221.1 PhoH family protein [Paracoccaceae bacterium]MDB4229716.1 PhoH family protein [Paracoccaceae bacterium]MDC1255538.1 PhoH family protein [Paracoccaceae bacterium]